MDLAMTLKTRMVQAQFLEVLDFFKLFQFAVKNTVSSGLLVEIWHILKVLNFGGKLTPDGEWFEQYKKPWNAFNFFVMFTPGKMQHDATYPGHFAFLPFFYFSFGKQDGQVPDEKTYSTLLRGVGGQDRWWVWIPGRSFQITVFGADSRPLSLRRANN